MSKGVPPAGSDPRSGDTTRSKFGTPHLIGRRSPPHPWEAAFLIGIFPGGELSGAVATFPDPVADTAHADRDPAVADPGDIRWAKVQIFSGGRNRSRHCLSAVEGMDGDPSVLVSWATPTRIHESSTDLSPGAISVDDGNWGVHLPGISWSGNFPSLRLECDSPRVTANTCTDDVFWWARIPRIVSYWSAFGTLAWNGIPGLGIVERAWGGDFPFDPASLIRRPWHWDVLACADGSVYAGLAVDVGLGLRGMRCGGRVTDSLDFTSGSGFRVRVREWRDEDGRRVPVRWEGAMRLWGGRLDYEARATTPVLPAVHRGGFIGFGFDGTYDLGGVALRQLSGAGFTEYRA